MTDAPLSRRTAMQARRFGNDDRAVTEVLGQILLVGVTVTMMGSLTLLVLAVEGPVDQTHVELKFVSYPGTNGWGTGDEAIEIRHLGGESMLRDTSLLRVRVNSVDNDFSGAALDGDWSDGRLSIGETWQAVLTLTKDDRVEVIMIDRDAGALVGSAILNVGDGSGGAGVTLTYVTSNVDTIGTTLLLPNAQSAADGGLEAVLDETAATAITADRSGAVAAENSVQNEDRIITDNDQRARFNNVGDWVEMNGFTLPPAAISISDISVVVDGKKRAASGSDPDMRMTYRVGAFSGITQGTYTITNAVADQTFVTNIFGDRAWAPADIPNLVLRLERMSDAAGFDDADIDAMFIRVTYGISGGASMNIEFRFDAVPAGASQQVEVEYRVDRDTFHVEVFNGANWNTRGILLTAGTPTVWSYPLTPSEFQAGTVRIRFIDETPGGAQAGQMLIDYARVRTT